jgi:monoterpene epsilon-lactone hydrolase
MAERRRLKLSGRMGFRLRALMTLLWSGLVVAVRRIIRGPRLPSWGLVFEASTHFLKASYRALYRFEDIQEGREFLDSLVILVPSLGEVKVEKVTSPVEGAWYRPESPGSGEVILYCHGAYAFYAESEKGLIADLAVKTGLPIFALDYHLTPEYPFPAQLEDAVQAYDWLLSLGYQANEIIALGTSAGGNLCLSLLLKLRDSGRSLPRLGVCLSPWTDLGNSGESIEANEPYDTLDRNMLEIGARWFVGEGDPQDPQISPLQADLRGLPPIYLQAGEREIFIDMIRGFYENAKSQGARVDLEVWESMNHVFQGFGDQIPEAVEAMDRIAEVVYKGF